MSVSVIMPLYNAASYLDEAVQSVLMQTEVKELIIVDDGSTDGSYPLVKTLEKRHSRVHVFTHPKHENKGSGASRNVGIHHARFDYIAFLDADDYYLENRFSRSLGYLNSHPEAQAVAESIELIPGSSVATDNLSDMVISKKISPFSLAKELMESQRFFLSLNGIIARSSFIKQLGYFDEGLLRTQDSDYVWRMALTQKLHTPFLNQIVAHYRRDNRNDHRSDSNVTKNRLLFYDKWIKISLVNHLPLSTLIVLFKSKIYNLSKTHNQQSLLYRIYLAIAQSFYYFRFILLSKKEKDKHITHPSAYFL